MPLMKPEIQEVLRKAGLSKDSKSENTLSQQLDSAGLSLDVAFETLYDLTRSNSENTRARAAETVLKLHGVMKETTQAAPTFTIVIQESPQNPASTPLPSFVPQGINPVLLPRPLLKELSASAKEKVN